MRSLLSALVLIALTAASVPAAIFVVNSTDDAVDANPGDGTCATAGGACTLRAAVMEANALTGDDEIDVPAGTYALTLTGEGEDDAATGDLDLTSLGTDKLSIVGAGSAVTIIDGQEADRVFDNFIDTSMSGLTIRNGHATTGLGQGGGIENIIDTGATLSLTDVVITGNSAMSGGGIQSDGALAMTNCTVSGNMAANIGGGINSIDDVVAEGVTISGNMADRGAGISNDLTLALTNSTISGNTAATSGGGLRNMALVTLTNVTLAGNAAPTGGGIHNFGDLTLAYTIVANSPSGGNCVIALGGTLTSNGHNLDSGTSCGLTGTGDLVSTDPMLGLLADNTGPTLTHALLPGSPAIDAGGDDCPPPTKDQRGVDRPADGDGDGIAACDIGAVEMTAQPGSTTTTTLLGGATTTTTLPPCPTATSFASVLCRLDLLAAAVQAGVPSGKLQTSLLAKVAKAKLRTQDADQAFTAGRKRTGKTKAAKAIRLMKKFKNGVTHKGRTLPAGVRSRLTNDSDSIRADLTTLRKSGGQS